MILAAILTSTTLFFLHGITEAEKPTTDPKTVTQYNDLADDVPITTSKHLSTVCIIFINNSYNYKHSI